MNLADPASERYVIAAAIQHGFEAFSDCDDLISPKTFSQQLSSIIWEAVRTAYNRDQNIKLDPPTIMSTVKELGYGAFFESKTEIDFLRALFNARIEASNARRYAAQIRKLEIGRLLHQQLEEAQTDISKISGNETIANILGLAENRIFDFSSLINDDHQSGPQHIAEGIDEWLENIIENPRDMVGISTGFPRYDRAIGGGLRRGTVSLIGARLKTGKTIIADSFSIHIAGKLNIPVLNLDSEMSVDQHWSRIIASISGVTIEEIETGKFAKNKQKRSKVEEAKEYLKTIPYSYICIAGMQFEDVLSNIRRWLFKTVGKTGETYNDCVVVYDYLKLMTSSGISNAMAEHQLLGFQMTALTNFAIKYQIPIMAFTQLNRSGINEESTAVVSQSDRLLWFASNFSIFKKKEAEEISEDDPVVGESYGNRKLIPLVCRHGAGLEIDGDYINVKLNGPTARVTEGLLRSEVQQEKAKAGFKLDPEDEELIL